MLPGIKFHSSLDAVMTGLGVVASTARSYRLVVLMKVRAVRVPQRGHCLFNSSPSCTPVLHCQGAFALTRLGWHFADSATMCAGGIAVDSNVSPPHDFAPRDENWAPNLLWASGTVHCARDAASLMAAASGSEAVSRHLKVVYSVFMQP